MRGCRRFALGLIAVAIVLGIGAFALFRVRQVSIPADRARDAVREAMALAQPAKTAVALYYAEQGRLPVLGDEVGLPTAPPRGKGRASIRVVAGGAVEISFDSHGAFRVGHIYLVPRPVGSSLSWQCVTPDIASLPRIAPDCQYAEEYSPSSGRGGEALTDPSEGRVTVHNLDGRSYELDIEGLLREGRVIGDSFLNWRPNALFPLMTEQSRVEVIARAMQRAAGRLPDARALNRFARILIDSGPSSIPSIEARLADSAADSSAAGLLAICEQRYPDTARLHYDRTRSVFREEASECADDCRAV